MNLPRFRTLSAGILLSTTLLCAAAHGAVAPPDQPGGIMLDRTLVPPQGKAPRLKTPDWTTSRLANGAALLVSEAHSLPVVQANLAFYGGSSQFDPPGKEGLAAMVAAMLAEGTQTRSGDQISDALQLLGTDVDITVGAESGSIRFAATPAKLPGVLAVVADMLQNPAFPTPALERLRARTLIGLKQGRDRTTVIAGRVFPRVLFGSGHPYGRVITEASISSIRREDLLSFHRRYFRPHQAVITVVGDVKSDRVKAQLDHALKQWSNGGSEVSFDYPPVPPLKATTIYLVDKPGAEQSSIVIGLPGPPRLTRDYYALQVMNTILGGLFQSRLNANIREDKGYSYGVRSAFSFGKGPGPFRALGDVVTDKTAPALTEFIRELRGVRGERPFTAAELEIGKAALVQSLPETFASTGATAAAISRLQIEGIPKDFYQTFADHIDRVSQEDLLQVARKYLDLEHLTIVVVGDRRKIEAPLKAANLGPIVYRDLEGNVISNKK